MQDQTVIEKILCLRPIPLKTAGISIEFAKKEDIPSIEGKLSLFTSKKLLRLQYLNLSASANTIYYYWSIWGR